MLKLKTPITWIGGKHYLASKIIPHFPQHITYVELFGGGASVILQKPPSKVEVFNDLNGDLINFFRTLRDKEKFKEFYEIVNLIPYSRKEFYDSIDSLHTGSMIEQAVKFFIIAKMSFGGNFGGGWGYSKFLSRSDKSATVNRWINTIKLLPEISNRLKEIQIDNRDYRILMKYFDDPKIFIYADPPYLNVKTEYNSYKNWSEKEHEEFLDLCLKSKSKIMISGYNSKLYEKKLVDWNIMTFKNTLYSMKKTNEKKDTVDEYIWTNYSINQEGSSKTLDNF